MKDRQIIELRPSPTTLVSTYGVLAAATFFATVWGFSRIDRLVSTGGLGEAVLLTFAAPAAILVAGGFIARKLTRPKAITLDQHGIRLRMHHKESVISWQDVDQIIYTRISAGKSTEPAVVVESQGRIALQLGSSYTISPRELFELIDNYVKTRSIPIPALRKPAWWEAE